MTREEAQRMAGRINARPWHGIGHAWVNTGLGEDDSSVSVRNTRGEETEITDYSYLPGHLGMVLFMAAHGQQGPGITVHGGAA
jgi:hypothetical protein